MTSIRRLSGVLIVASMAISGPVTAAQNILEEIVVTARKQPEGLRDVPVTVSAFSGEELERFGINSLTDAAKKVPNFYINHGGSGSGSNLYLRGIGSSSISAAFEQSVALNIDGVVVNQGRFIQNAFLDMKQLEVLKGPQSLYFGKSATAGVVSMTSRDPGDEFEASLMAGIAPEHDGNYYEAIISGPLTDTFGARLALSTAKRDELYKNITPGVAKPWRGDETTTGRLTLLWQATDNLTAKLKYSYAAFESDGPNAPAEEICPEGQVQPTVALGIIFPGVDDCKLNGNTSEADLHPALIPGNPLANNGVPYLDQDTTMTTLQLDWLVSDTLSITSVTSLTELDHDDFDIYDYNAGLFGGGHRNAYDSFAQELRLHSNLDGVFNYQVGLFYQDFEQEFDAYQYIVNIGILTPDPITGNGYDYDKRHVIDGDVKSIFVAGYWDVTEDIEITAGLRYTEEEKTGSITVPYVHLLLQGTFSAPPRIDGLKFDDTNTSPEVAVNWHINDNVSVFAAYKEGFKSGGIDTSVLPTQSLNATNPDFPEFLLFDSEEAEGYEIGVKSSLLTNSLRLNATVFDYDYTGLQVQLFDSTAIQYTTFNASQLRTFGAEADLLWLTAIEGLTIQATLALTDTEYTKDFFNLDGQNLKDEDRERSADLAGSVGIVYDMALSKGWRLEFAVDSRYNDGYALSAQLNPFEQSSFWLHDASVRLYSEDDRWELSLIGRNLGDEIYAYSAGSRPGACVMADPTNPDPARRCAQNYRKVLATEQDNTALTSLGRQYMFQARVRF